MSILIGRIIRALMAVVLAVDALSPFFAPETTRMQMVESGFPLAMGPVIGGAALLSAILYAIPRTAMLGAILATGFFGGAICTHVRMGEFGSPPQLISLTLGVLVWLGLYLSDPRVRALIPLRSPGA